MSKRSYKTQASSTRVAFGTPNLLQSNATATTAEKGIYSSQLSYLTEPPSLEHISDPKLVVLLKNLSKKDGITKAKALDDILGLIGSAEYESDSSVVEAWVGFDAVVVMLEIIGISDKTVCPSIYRYRSSSTSTRT